MTTRVTASLLANTAVTPGNYGGTTQHSVFTVDAQGRIISSANATPSIANTQITGLITTSQIAGRAITPALLANTSVVAGSYGSPTQYPVISVDAQGRVLGVTNQTVTTTTNQTTFGVTYAYDKFNGNGSTTNFTLNRSITGANTVDVFVNGVVQEFATVWNASGNSMTFTDPPPTGANNVVIKYTVQPGAVALIDTVSDTSNSTSGRAATPLAVNTAFSYTQSVAAFANSNFFRTVTDDTTTNATRYVLLTQSTSGAITGGNVSSSKLTFNPSTGLLSSTGLRATSSSGVSFSDSTTQTTAAITGVGNGLSVSSYTAAIACPSRGSIGSYTLAYSSGVTMTAGSNYSPGSGSGQLQSFAWYNSDGFVRYVTTDDLTGTWKWMSGTTTGQTGPQIGLVCRVS